MRSMKLPAAFVLAGTLCLLPACGKKAETYTLYRNSSLDYNARIHWGTFNANESLPTYNSDNCGMAARLLTANMKALNGAGYNSRRGFWCERGAYNPSGGAPASFEGAFPTDTQ